MITSLIQYTDGGWHNYSGEPDQMGKISLILCFADRQLLESQKLRDSLRTQYPEAQIVFCSTSGEILGIQVQENTAVSVLFHFDNTPIEVRQGNRKSYENSRMLGSAVAGSLPRLEEIRYLMVISDGGVVNGDELISGIQSVIPPGVPISGGLAGDGDRFQRTLVGHNDVVEQGELVLIAFYGDHIRVGTGQQGGWDMFGPERTITRSDGNVLYEVDGQNALDLYKRYLDTYAEQLPASALLFPLSVREAGKSEYVVRTILSINEKDKTMTFAGTIPQGSVARLMKSNPDRLIRAGAEAAGMAVHDAGSTTGLAMIVSCVGRKLVLAERVEEEIEAVAEVMPVQTPMIGFFSYGELSPVVSSGNTRLHNQTITVTYLTEQTPSA